MWAVETLVVGDVLVFPISENGIVTSSGRVTIHEVGRARQALRGVRAESREAQGAQRRRRVLVALVFSHGPWKFQY